MKLLHSLSMLLAATSLAGCAERIDDRFKKAQTDEPARVVLIEEYTGVECRNCPAGHEMLRTIEQQYNTRISEGIGVISVGIHIPAYGDPVDAGGFVTPEASALAPGQNSAPAARINRRGDTMGLDRWLRAVASEIARPPLLTFNPCLATLTPRGIKVEGSAISPTGINGAKLNIWIVEDDIVDYQLNDDGHYDEAYVHHAVYRASVTGLNGQDIDLTRNNEEHFALNTYPVHPNWNTDNLRAVIFITDESGEVLNATQAPVQ